MGKGVQEHSYFLLVIKISIVTIRFYFSIFVFLLIEKIHLGVHYQRVHIKRQKS